MGAQKKNKGISRFFGRIKRAIENVKAINAIRQSLTDIERQLQEMEEVLQRHNHSIEKLAEKEECRELAIKVESMRKQLCRLECSVEERQTIENAALQVTDSADKQEAGSHTYGKIDYFDFENYFRGSRETIKERQKEYLPYFMNKKAVLDLGCGRGEFLELLKENGVIAKGVDFYDEFVMYCQNRGLDVIEGDAIACLARAESTDGIFAGQLVEHLSIGQIISLCMYAYEKLEDGGYLILETPNPMSLAIYTHAFYIDPSHQKPVHPYTLRYLVEKAGFQKVEILFTQGSRLPEHIPKLEGNEISNLEEFNQDLQTMAEFLYGSQDYAIIAQKKLP